MQIRTLPFSLSLLFLLFCSACIQPASQDVSTTSEPSAQNDDAPVARALRIDRSSFQGKSYHELRELEDFKQAEGMSGNVISANSKMIYTLSFYRNGEKLLVALEKVLKPNEQEPFFEALDMIELSDIQEDWVVLHEGCFRDDQLAVGIVTLCRREENAEFLTRIQMAWQANINRGTLEIIDPKLVKCRNPRYEG